MKEPSANIITLIVLLFLFILLIFFIVISLAVRYRRKKRETEVQARIFETQLMNVKFEIQEDTLKYVSRELHDNIGQIASLIKINLNTLQFSSHITLEEKIANLKTLSTQLLADLRLLSVTLNNEKFENLGLINALKIEKDKIEKTGLYELNLSLQEPLPVLSSETSLILYRMIQEILNNILKHAEGNKIDISAAADGNKYIIKIQDNGRGCDVQGIMADSAARGSGLLNLQSRATMISANYKIESAENEGTLSTIQIDLNG